MSSRTDAKRLRKIADRLDRELDERDASNDSRPSELKVQLDRLIQIREEGNRQAAEESANLDRQLGVLLDAMTTLQRLLAGMTRWSA